MTCDEVREKLLAFLYGATEDGEHRELEAHLAGCDACRRALAVAEGQRDLLADAARMEVADVAFAPPAPRGRIRRIPRALRVAAALLLIAAGILAVRQTARARVLERHPLLSVTAPVVASPAEPAEYVVRATDLDGDPVDAAVTATCRDVKGEVVAKIDGVADDDGAVRIAVPPAIGAPGDLLFVSFETTFDRAPARAASAVLQDGRSLVARVETDKPLHRPGEVVRCRGVVLERFRLTPAGASLAQFTLRNAAGTDLFGVPAAVKDGVAATELALPGDLPGGQYELVLTHPGGSFPEAVRELTVHAYRPPRLLAEVDLDADSYAPGARASAAVKIARAEGGVPAGATVDAVVKVDGEEVARSTHVVTETGAFDVDFALPAEIESPRGLLALTITDGGTVETATEPIPVTLHRLDVDLFPEGGDLVAGLPARVYFRVRDAAGEPASLTADVVDGDGAVVATAKTDVEGMGRFEITPAAGARYRLVAKRPIGVELRGEAVEAVPAGVTLRALDDGIEANGDVRLTVGATSAGEREVVVYCRGAKIGEARAALAAGETKPVRVPTTSDAGGVLRVTVLDADGKPRAERLVSREPARRVQVEMRPAKKTYVPGDEVRVAVTTRDETGKPVPAVLGVSVVDRAVLNLANDEDTPDLPMHFLLGMEVKELEDVKEFAANDRAVDLLLGTQGWRRFDWVKAVVAGAPPETVSKADDPEPIRAAVAREVARSDRTVFTWAGVALLLTVLVGAGVLLWRSGRRRIVVGALSFSPLAVLVIVLVVTSLTPLYKSARPAPVGAAVVPDAAPVDLIVNQVVPVNGQEVPPDYSDAGGLPMLVRGFSINSERPPNIGGGGGGRGGRGFYTYYSTNFGGAGGGAVVLTSIEPIRLDGGTLALGAYSYRVMEVPVREYAYIRTEAIENGRRDFADVLYWNPSLVTDAHGVGEFSFQTSDLVSTFDVGAQAFDSRGGLGAGSAAFTNRLPFFLTAKLPEVIGSADTVTVPVSVANDTVEPMDLTVRLARAGETLALTGEADRGLRVDAGARGRVSYTVRPAPDAIGPAVLTVAGEAPGGLRDEVRRTIDVVPNGYPVEVSRSGVFPDNATAAFVLPAETDRATLTGSLSIYPSTVATLREGIASMLRAPGGCFEQVSSSTYPNVLVLSWLTETNTAEPQVEKLARKYLEDGYRRLVAYECDGGGFEWFGHGDGHEALTAYGLMEFREMAAFVDVDEAMLERTERWLLGRRDGDGGFEQPDGGHSFGNASKDVWDAYILWALSAAAPKADLSLEIGAVTATAAESDDPYLLALAILTLENRGLESDGLDGAPALRARLAKLQADDGGFTGTRTSITGSRGANLKVETTALAVLALYPDPAHAPAARRAVEWLLGQRREGGGFGATQATVLALRALVEHARRAPESKEAREITVLVNGTPVATRLAPAGGAKAIDFGGAELLPALVTGVNEIEIRATGKAALPWSLSVGYRTSKPPSDPDCAVAITTSLDRAKVREGETVGLTVTVTNREKNSVPMTLARVGLPAGLEPRPDLLKELRDTGALDWFETRPREIVLYFRGLDAGEKKTVRLDLAAAFPGEYQGPASSAYLYYTDDSVDWAPPLTVTVE